MTSHVDRLAGCEGICSPRYTAAILDRIERDLCTHGSTCYRRRFSLGTDLAVEPGKHRMFAVLLWALRVHLVSAAGSAQFAGQPSILC